MPITKDESYWATVRAIVDRAPPLTPEQRDKLAILLRGSRPDAAR